MLRRERKYEKRTQLQIFCHREKERAWDRVGGGKEKASYFGPNIHSCGKYTFMLSKSPAMRPQPVSSSSLENVHKIHCSSFSVIVYKRHCKAGNAFWYPTMWIILKRSLFFRFDLTQCYKIIPAGALERLNPLRIGFKREKKDRPKKLFSITQFKKKKKKIPPSNI